MIFKKYQKAFSLVELSMVILIIGILIAGVSQGIDLYGDFKLASARNLTSGSIVARVPNLSMWWETTMETSFINSRPNEGDLINRWNDINSQRVMKVNLLNAPNDATRPTYKASAINGLPALKFSNAQNLRSADINGDSFFSNNEITVFLLQNTTGGQDSTMSWVPTTNNLDAGGSEIARFNLHLSHNNIFYFDFGGRIEASGADASFKKNNLFSFKRSGSEMNMRLNGQQISYSSSIAGIISNSYIAPFVVGKLRTDYNYQFEGLIGEIIIYGSGLHINEIQKIEAYLAKKWGIKI
jgi:prepilin-type N-terminal cleavage/methylation domain-containing protein